ncbi:MAG: hypothetical protein ACOWW1_08040 [archaeon]
MKLWRKTDKIFSKDTKKLYNQLIQNGISHASAKNVIKVYET